MMTALSVSALALAGCDRRGAEGPAAPLQTEAPAQDLIARLASDPDLTVFVSALNAASAADLLAGPGPYTVFAPVNAAFDAIPIAERERLLTPEGAQDLRRLVTLHVAPGRLTVAELDARSGLPDAEGRSAAVRLPTLEGRALLAGESGAGRWAVAVAPDPAPEGGERRPPVALPPAAARLVEADSAVSNGVVHKLDSVLSRPPRNN